MLENDATDALRPRRGRLGRIFFRDFEVKKAAMRAPAAKILASPDLESLGRNAAPLSEMASLKYNYAPNAAFAIAFAVCAYAAHLAFPGILFRGWGPAAVLCVSALWLFFVFYKVSVRNAPIRAVLRRAAFLKYGIEPLSGFSPAGLARELARDFNSFACGDESRRVDEALNGVASFDGAPSGLLIYRFSYVEVSQVYDAANKRMRKERKTFRHNGVILENFPFMPRMELRGSYGRRWAAASPGRWKTSLDSFNRAFEITCNDETECAKFLSPAVILRLESLAGAFSSLSIESAGGRVNVTFADRDLLDLEMRFGDVASSPGLIKSIASGRFSAPKYEFLLRVFSRIKAFNDSNF